MKPTVKRKVMMVGAVGAGKTSLAYALGQRAKEVSKTSDIEFYDDAIDTPGEYAQIPRFYSALLVTSMQAAGVLIVQDASQRMPVLPPGFAGMFTRPVVGLVTKVDLEKADRERARRFLVQAGVKEPVFFVSSHTGEGLDELTDCLEQMDRNSSAGGKEDIK